MKHTAGRAWFRLQSALHSGTGHVVVTADERDKAAALVDAALERSTALTVLRLRATSADPLAVIDEGATDAKSASKRRETLRELLEKARAVEANVFAVVEDADTASAEELERVRMAVECVPDAIERLRVVLVGTPQLDLTLQEPAASALASRVSAHVRFTPQRKTATGAALNKLTAIRVAAAGVMTVAVTSLFGRNETPPHRKVSSQPASAREIGAEAAAASDGSLAQVMPSTDSSGDDLSVVDEPAELAAAPAAAASSEAPAAATASPLEAPVAAEASTAPGAASIDASVKAQDAGAADAAPAATAPAEQPEAPRAAETLMAAAEDAATAEGVAAAAEDAATAEVVAAAAEDSVTAEVVAAAAEDAATAEVVAAAAEDAATAEVMAAAALDAQIETANINAAAVDVAASDAPAVQRDDVVPARASSSAIAQVTAQVARAERAVREGSASVDTRGARGASSVAPPKRSPPASAQPARTADGGKRLKQPTIVEAAAFKDAADAQSLQEQLAARVDHVQVTRVKAGRGTLYSVRVTDLESAREIAHAEREIRTLGHRPVRISQAAPRPTSGNDGPLTEPVEDGAPPLTGAFRPGARHR